MSEITEEHFLKSVKDHRLESVKEDGVLRHLKFRQPNTIYMWFDLITWNGTLCIEGDMGTYTFRRVDDMFMFFRATEEDLKRKPERTLPINPSYWHEKMISQDKSGAKKWDQEYFEKCIKERFDDYFYDKSSELKKDAWEEVEWKVLGESELEYPAMRAAMDFKHGDHRPFQDFWEWDCKTYTYYFLWCLYAIVWGIKKYDEQKLETVYT